MAVPIALIMGAVNAASSLFSGLSTARRAKKQAQEQLRQREEAGVNTVNAFIQNSSRLNQRFSQQREAEALQRYQADRSNLQQLGMLEFSQELSGLTGNNSDIVLNDAQQQVRMQGQLLDRQNEMTREEERITSSNLTQSTNNQLTELRRAVEMPAMSVQALPLLLNAAGTFSLGRQLGTTIQTNKAQQTAVNQAKGIPQFNLIDTIAKFRSRF